MTFTTFAELESTLAPEPLFPVEAPGARPEDKTRWSEDYRQRSFVAWLTKNHPDIIVFSITNEGARGVFHGRRLKQRGLLPGAPDICVLWQGGWAFVEFKGWAADGTPGKLSTAQIETCNRIHKNGTPVAMFYRADKALDWLRELGAPIRERAA